MIFSFPLCGFQLTFSPEGIHAVYALLSVFAWSLSLSFTPRYLLHHSHRGRYYFFTLLTFAATVGVFLSRDLLTTFIFFEIMSFSSFPWVAQEESASALKASRSYLAVAVFGGMSTLMGLFWLNHLAGTLDFEGLQAYAESIPNRSVLYIPSFFAFLGFAAKAGVFPLHFWLPEAHPVAPAPASALLSGLLTKTGVFGMIVLSVRFFYGDFVWGNALLLLAGVTMLLGAVRAVFSTDLKQTLAFSTMSQIGFILTGLAFTVLSGRENALASSGTLLHMINHTLLKLDLFLCAGAVYMNAHTLNLTELRGFGRKKPLLHICFALGYLGLIGLPLFNGYLSKSLLHEAIVEYAELAPAGRPLYRLYEMLFLFSGGLTAAYMTKLYLCLFWFRNRSADIQKKWDGMKSYLTPVSAAALLLSAIVLPLLGLFPDLFARSLTEAGIPFLRGEPLSSSFRWFSSENLLGAAISLTVGAFCCWLIHRFLVPKGEYLNLWPDRLNLADRFYRPLVKQWLPKALFFCTDKADTAVDSLLAVIRRFFQRRKKLNSPRRE